MTRNIETAGPALLASSSPLRSLCFPAAILVAAILLASGSAVAKPVPQGQDFQVNAYTTDVQALPAVAVASDGSFVVVWESDGQLEAGYGTFVRQLTASGDPVGDDVQANVTAVGDQWDADIAIFEDGGFVVVWDDDSGVDGEDRGIGGRLFDSMGQPVGAELRINAVGTGDQNDPVVATAPGGNFIVAWEDEIAGSGFDEDLEFRLFDSAGTPLTGDVPLNVNQTNDQEDLDISADSAGNFVAVWESYGQDTAFESVVARRIDSTGTPVGDEILVNTFTTGNQEDPDLAVADDGSFLVVWEDDTQNAATKSVYGRFFGPDGMPTTGEILVSTGGVETETPRATFDSAGNGVVVWDSNGQDSDGGSIMMSTLDPMGMAVQPETVINTLTSGFQIIPHVAANDGGELVVVWMDTGGADGSATSIRGRRFSESFFSDGFESGNTLGWSSTSP